MNGNAQTMMKNENKSAVSAEALEATQIVKLEDLKEMEDMHSISADEAAASERSRASLLRGAVLGMLLAAAVIAAFLAASLHQKPNLPAARTVQSGSHY